MSRSATPGTSGSPQSRAPARSVGEGSVITLVAQGRRFALEFLRGFEPNNGREVWEVRLRINGEDVTKKYFGEGRAFLNINLSRCEMLSLDSRYVYIPAEGAGFVIDAATLDSLHLPSVGLDGVFFQGATFQGPYLLSIYRRRILVTDPAGWRSSSLSFPEQSLAVKWASFEGPNVLRITYSEPPSVQEQSRVVELDSLSWETSSRGADTLALHARLRYARAAGDTAIRSFFRELQSMPGDATVAWFLVEMLEQLQQEQDTGFMVRSAMQELRRLRQLDILPRLKVVEQRLLSLIHHNDHAYMRFVTALLEAMAAGTCACGVYASHGAGARELGMITVSHEANQELWADIYMVRCQACGTRWQVMEDAESRQTPRWTQC